MLQDKHALLLITEIFLHYLDSEGEIIFCTLPGIGDTYAPVATSSTIHFIPKVNTILNVVDSIAWANLWWNYRPIYNTVFHLLLYAELSDNADQLLRILISRRHYIIQIHVRLLLALNFYCKRILLKYMSVCQLLTQACSLRMLLVEITLIKEIPKSETKIHKFFTVTLII